MTITQPNNSGYPLLTDDRILMRQVEATDIPDLVDISFYDGIPATDVDMARTMQAKIDQDILNGNSIHWCIIDKATDQLVGTCGYYRGLDKNEGELGCVLLRQFRGKGYMSGAMQLAIDYGRNSIGLKRIWAVTTKDNLPAIKLLKDLNFRKVADLDQSEVEYELVNRG